MRSSIIHLLLTGLNIPFPPRSDNLQIRGQGFHRGLKAHLVVAFAGCAVGNGHRALLAGNLHQAAGNQRPGKGSAQQIFALVNRAGFHCGVNIIGDKLIPQILNIKFGCAGFNRLFFQRSQLLALANVGAHCNNIIAVMLLQPRNNNRSIQTTGIGQHNLFFLLTHLYNSSFFSFTLFYFFVYILQQINKFYNIFFKFISY